ncbi:MAG: hypothetical protein HY867_00305 [Chloroflexi bacterium]|nr:hypothetical protein [Chloroflexota bacterium]
MTIGKDEKPIKRSWFSQISCKMGRMKFKTQESGRISIEQNRNGSTKQGGLT